MIKVGFKRLTNDAILPVKTHPTDSGFDLFANESVIIEPGETKVIKTGIAVQLPPGYEAQVRPRSGVTSKTKLRVQLGTIDNGYSGEIGVIVDNINWEPYNHSTGAWVMLKAANTVDSGVIDVNEKVGLDSYLIQKGDKLAQLVIQQLPQVEEYEIDKLQESDRGSKGFGSSGY